MICNGIHMSAIVALRLIGPLASWNEIFTLEVKEAAYKGLVRPVLEYSGSVWDPSGVGLQNELEKIQNQAARFVTGNYNFETGSMTGILEHLKWESLKKRRRDSRLILLYKGLKGKASIPTGDPWLGAAGMIILWHIRSPLLTLIFISVAFSPKPLGIGIHFQTLLSPLLKVPRMVLLSSLLWWVLGTSLSGPGPGEWLSFWRVTSKHFWFFWFWSDWADVQADLSLRWAHMSFYWFCHGAAQIIQLFSGLYPIQIFRVKNTAAARQRKNEPSSDKTNKMACAPSEDSDQPGHPPSLIRVFAVRMKKAWVTTHWAHSEDYDQTGRLPRLIWVFDRRTCHFVGFVTRRLKYVLKWPAWSMKSNKMQNGY